MRWKEITGVPNLAQGAYLIVPRCGYSIGISIDVGLSLCFLHFTL